MKNKFDLLSTMAVFLFMSFFGSLFAEETLYIKKTDNTVLSIPTSEIETMYFKKNGTVTGITGQTADGVKDIDGNVYQTVTIGKQTWMKSDLKVTRFNDGTPIANITGDKEWNETTGAAYSWYNNEIPASGDPYGAIYNGFSAINGKICPEGWRVPDINDWKELLKFCGTMGYDAPVKLKEAGISHWLKQNDTANNETGFTALPNGKRHNSGMFRFRTESGAWWTSTEKSSSLTKMTIYTQNSPVAFGEYPKNYGFCIRCIKDEFK
jgi:uncharacterized protein (TIGR02145 family)